MEFTSALCAESTPAQGGVWNRAGVTHSNQLGTHKNELSQGLRADTIPEFTFRK